MEIISFSHEATTSPSQCPRNCQELRRIVVSTVDFLRLLHSERNSFSCTTSPSGDESSSSSSNITPVASPKSISPLKNIRRKKNVNLLLELFESSDRQIVGEENMMNVEASTSFSDMRLVFEGLVLYKTSAAKNDGANNKKVHRCDADWRQYWAALRRNNVLYMYNERPVCLPFIVDVNDAASGCGLTIDVSSCIADVAYDYAKYYKNTFRVVTQNQVEHLFKTEATSTMIKWLENILQQTGDNSENNPNGLTNSMALIIKRYETHSLSVSPSSKTKKLTFFTKTASTPSPVSKKKTSKVQQQPSSSPNVMSPVFAPDEDVTPIVKQKKWKKSSKMVNAATATVAADSPNSDAVFGQPLERCLTGDNEFVPLIVQLCVKVVERHGLNVVGVYRIPGNTANVNFLISSLEKGFENTNFNDYRWRDVNVVSSLLKAFFRKLPDSLLTDKLYQQFIDVSRVECETERLRKLHILVKKLPMINFETLKFLLAHLRKVVEHSNVNKMQARNLALMFGPSLLRSKSDSMTTMVSHMTHQCEIVETLILHSERIFSCFDEKKENVDRVHIEFLSNLSKRKPRQRKSSNSFNERNIDDEIESRRKVCETVVAKQMQHSSSGNLGKSKESIGLSQAAEDRRTCAENIYAARRIFIGGEMDKYGSSDRTSTATTEEEEPELAQKIDCLLKHSRHLNGNPRSLDVFSPETREKIRKFQNDNRLLLRRSGSKEKDAPTTEDDYFEESSGYSTTSTVNDERSTVPAALSAYCQGYSHQWSSGYSSDASPLTPHTGSDAQKQFRRADLNDSSPPSDVRGRLPSAPVFFSTKNGDFLDKTVVFHENISQSCDVEATFNGGAENGRAHRMGRSRHAVAAVSAAPRRVPWYETDDDDVGDVFYDEMSNGNGNEANCKQHAGRRASAKLYRKAKFRSQSVTTDKRKVSKEAVNGIDMQCNDSSNVINERCMAMGVHRKASKSRKFKAWLKDSFRRSSPDLALDCENLESEGIVTKV